MGCTRCSKCCKLFVINLTEAEYKSNNYKTQFEDFGITKDFEEAELCGANIITQKEDGSCIYLKSGKCSIYSKRPKSCRDFFCDSKDPKFKAMVESIHTSSYGLNTTLKT